MSFLLFEDHSCLDLLPLTYCRPVYDLRAGIFTNLDRWQKYLDTEVFQLCRPYLRTLPPEGFYTWINGKIIPNQEIARMLNDVPENTFYVDQDGEVLCAKGRWEFHDAFAGQLGEGFFTGLGWKAENVHWDGLKICYPEDLFSLNGQLLRQDFDLAVQSGPSSETLSDPHSRVYGVDNLFISPGVKIQAAILNAEDGPIYFGPNSKVQEGAIIHGAHAICESARINMGAKLRGDTTIGPMCKVGGEVANSIMMGYSNKGHEGYLGNSVLGHWCNLGADTNTSNLKNNYSEVKIWHYPSGRFRQTGKQFCGLIMGDHSKCGINTMFNTGTVVGVSANIFGTGYPRNFIPSFAWGGIQSTRTYRLDKALETAEIVMPRKGKALDQQEKSILGHVYEISQSYRRWENS